MKKTIVSTAALSLMVCAEAAKPNLNWLPPEAVANSTDEIVLENPAPQRGAPSTPQMLTPNTVSSDIAAMMRSMRGEIQRNVGTATQSSSASQALTTDERLLRQYIVRGKPLKVDICSNTVESGNGTQARPSADTRIVCMVQGVSVLSPRGN
ncbi:hypothetical protein [Ideonella sp. A 288]|uniref:hypothetical protein n=1 Tax=Ideonella sp. A 288 TaxID=1962181 RepID=UPI0011847D64|nr:hypothetical protein [Ideonella sp. A 288]